MISLMPTEPVDTKDPEPSLQSDNILESHSRLSQSARKSQGLALRRSQIEGVSHRLLLNDRFADLAAIATRDSADLASIHYLFRFWQPRDFALAQQSDGRYYYSLHLETELSGPNNQVVYKDTQQFQHIFTEQQVDANSTKSFGIENRLPASPRRTSAPGDPYQRTHHTGIQSNSCVPGSRVFYRFRPQRDLVRLGTIGDSRPEPRIPV